MGASENGGYFHPIYPGFFRETNDQSMDFGIAYFQTNPWTPWKETVVLELMTNGSESGLDEDHGT